LQPCFKGGRCLPECVERLMKILSRWFLVDLRQIKDYRVSWPRWSDEYYSACKPTMNQILLPSISIRRLSRLHEALLMTHKSCTSLLARSGRHSPTELMCHSRHKFELGLQPEPLGTVLANEPLFQSREATPEYSPLSSIRPHSTIKARQPSDVLFCQPYSNQTSKIKRRPCL
jgi:hypothetical protein